MINQKKGDIKEIPTITTGVRPILIENVNNSDLVNKNTKKKRMLRLPPSYQRLHQQYVTLYRLQKEIEEGNRPDVSPSDLNFEKGEKELLEETENVTIEKEQNRDHSKFNISNNISQKSLNGIRIVGKSKYWRKLKIISS